MQKPILTGDEVRRTVVFPVDLWDAFEECVFSATNKRRQTPKALRALVQSYVNECEAEQAVQAQIEATDTGEAV